MSKVFLFGNMLTELAIHNWEAELSRWDDVKFSLNKDATNWADILSLAAYKPWYITVASPERPLSHLKMLMS